MVVLHTDAATSRLGEPATFCEYGTVEAGEAQYRRYWNWNCGCRGEIIAGTLIALESCAAHACAA